MNWREIEQVTELLLGGLEKKREAMPKQPDKTAIINMLKQLQCLLFPGYFESGQILHGNDLKNRLNVTLAEVLYELSLQTGFALRYEAKYENSPEEEVSRAAYGIARQFISKLPKIKDLLETDVEALYDGDPAATGKAEIIIAYPGLYAGMVYRIAHELQLLSIPLIPRIMSEHAHSITGIDIHPGASIGNYFFMDHGTGIVIGETTSIGDHVKLYQGVTLGALSTRDGQNLRKIKRHPTLGDHVTVYSGASILGGDTVIGANSVIGGNAFIVKSIPAGTVVMMKNLELQYENGETT